MDKKALIEEISILVDMQCKRKHTNKSKLSIELGKNSRYLNNMFSKNETFDISIICQIALLLECEPSILIPDMDFLKTLNEKSLKNPEEGKN